MRIIGEREILTEVTRWPIGHRVPFVVLDRGHLCADSHCLLLRREDGEVEVPVAAIAVVLIEPGVTVTHEAIRLAADHGTLLMWVGEAGVRLYSVGMPGGKQPLRLLEQAQIVADPTRRIAAAQRIYRLMFGEDMPATRSIEKLRGMEGARVRRLYQEIAARFGVPWEGRAESPSPLRDALGFATSCLYGLSEAVIVASGYSPALGIIHAGDNRSLVFDLADTVKFATVVPAAFDAYRESRDDIRTRVRRKCRDLFREQQTARRLFDNLFHVFEADQSCGL